MKTILFVCIHNSARSQMAEAFTRAYGSERFIAFSAGIEPGKLNPIVVQAMAEKGIDISGQPCRSVEQHLAEQGAPDIVVTVCDEASAERCPAFNVPVQRLHWGFADPSALAGSDAEKLARTRVIRDEISARIQAFCTGDFRAE
ncbi:arsenate reductase ArsC [Simiduia agarivorans]|uniref:Protein-tyrosine phosphatase, low molecular weight n=1 Tax=Simiduia agarivorans (strain DSM 21679 / JCM 13881 / BCRC 17597 / SA1) TaxID=1117647 RepID=K4KJ77_SIMAS|nr:arsenate reductase ArsC [Simiduia agarivorans]AFU99174.1 protein-tyrosine phosphatase, low molecular weight [Simiduia agarivorans SA1 = DSM 21679]